MRHENKYVGQRFGRLVVEADWGVRKSYYTRICRCRCDCGAVKDIHLSALVRGLTKSCGCKHRENDENRVKHGYARRTGVHPVYQILKGMLSRCENPKNRNFRNYGGRGISVCQEWHNPVEFVRWATANGYKPGLSIERRDVNGNYEPSNCCWIPLADQQLNKRNRKPEQQKKGDEQ